MSKIIKLLDDFRVKHTVKGKGALSVVLHVTRFAIENGLPLDSDLLQTGGQVAGQGRARVQKILADHGIVAELAREGGRTSRGGVSLMIEYVAFLNENSRTLTEKLTDIETYWIGHVHDFLKGKPLRLKYESSSSVGHVVNDLVKQAIARQKALPGSTYAGSVIQHLVGAKLELALLNKVKIDHHGASVADAVSLREGDFSVGDAIIHVTMHPSDDLLRKCIANIEKDLRPIIVTTGDMIEFTRKLAELQEISAHVEVLSLDQFIATNVLEKSLGKNSKRKHTVSDLVKRYNEIVRKHESDPSLLIETID